MSSGSLRKLAPPVLVASVYLLAALYAYKHTDLIGSASMPGCACGDQAQEVSFLAWPTFALGHGLNPLLTSWVNYPNGVNLAANTSAPLLGFLAIPVVLTLGPVAAFNLLLVLGLALSALSMCLVLKRWITWWPAAFAGGLLYGFSPYMIGQGVGHLFLVFIPIPPLILLVLDEILVRQSGSARRYGLLLGALAAAQYFISVEVLAMTGIIALIGIVLIGARHWRLVKQRARHVAESVIYAALVCGALIGYPVWLGFFGPEGITRLPQPANRLPVYPGDLLGAVVPTISQVLAPSHLKAIGDRLSDGDVVENGMYLGVPLMLTLAAIAWGFRRVRGVVFLSVMLLVSYLLGLGRLLYVDGHDTGVPLPFTFIAHVPVIQNILAVRFSLFIQFFAALLLAIGLNSFYEGLRSRLGRRNKHSRLDRSRRWAPAFATTVVAAGALVLLLPAVPFAGASIAVPKLLDSPAIDHLAVGSVVLTYPYPSDPRDQILIPQAISNMRFKIVGGPGHIPHTNGVRGPSILSPPIVQSIFNEAISGTKSTAFPPLTASNLDALRAFLVRYKIDTIIVYPEGSDPAAIRRYVSAVLGAPQWVDQVDAWFRVQALVSRQGQGTTALR